VVELTFIAFRICELVFPRSQITSIMHKRIPLRMAIAQQKNPDEVARVRTWLRRRVWVAVRRWCLCRLSPAELESCAATATTTEQSDAAADCTASASAVPALEAASMPGSIANSSGVSVANSSVDQSAMPLMAGAHLQPQDDSRTVHRQQFCVCDENQTHNAHIPCAPCVSTNVLMEAPCDVMRNILMYL
jgi:hypothetical protein